MYSGFPPYIQDEFPLQSEPPEMIIQAESPAAYFSTDAIEGIPTTSPGSAQKPTILPIFH